MFPCLYYLDVSIYIVCHGVHAMVVWDRGPLVVIWSYFSLFSPCLCVVWCRIEGLEQKVLVDSGEMPALVCTMKQQVEAFRQKLEVLPLIL